MYKHAVKKSDSFWRRHTIFRRSVKAVFLVGLTTVLGIGVYISSTLKDIPQITTQMLKSDNSTNMYASDGKTLIWSSARYRRKYVDIKDVPNTYKRLLLATEDSNFYHENGASVKGMANAGLSLVKSKISPGSAVRGGSGIEQQLIKLTVFSTSAADRTISRKVKELYLAKQLDKNYSKDKILEFYINKIYEGENSYGAQTIAYTYFGKPLSKLTTSQQAIIAGLGQSPTSYNLYNNPKLVKLRRDVVLQRGLQQHALSKSEYEKAKNTPVQQGLKKRFWQAARTDTMTEKHNAFVTSALHQIKSLGYDIDKTPVQIKTTLNIKDENHILNLFNHNPQYFQDNKQQAAVTITDPTTGDVLVQIGGRHSNSIGALNRATNTNRSSGSSIKPILDYGPAFEYFNWATNHFVSSSAYRYAGTNIYAFDYGGSQHPSTNAQVAIRQSYNAAALRTLDAVGPTRAKKFISKLGMTTNQPLQGSTGISMNVSTAEMAGAIGAYGQSGIYRPNRYIKSLTFSDNSVKDISFKEVQAMRPSTAFVMTSILQGVFSNRGTAADAKVNGVAMAGKTGTNAYPDGLYANSAMDLWTIGYTKSISAALWYGYDHPMEPGNQMNELQGDSNKDRLFKAIMAYMNKDKDVSDWKKPDTVTSLGGTGLSANYVANDHPKDEDTKSLSKVNTSVIHSYPQGDPDKINPTKPNVPHTSKNYDVGAWRTTLDNQRKEFYSKHKHDMENAKKVKTSDDNSN